MAEGVGQAIVLALCALIPAGFGAYLIRWGLQNKADGDAFLADATETVAEVIETSQSQTRDRDGDRRTRYSAKVAFAPEGHEPVTAWISGVAREGDRIRICYRRSDPTQVRRADAVYEASGLLYVIGAGCLLIALQFLGGSVSKLYMASKKGTWRDEDRLLHLSSRRPSLTSLDEAVRDGAPELPRERLRKVERLWADGNALTELPGWVADLDRLRGLNLAYNGLTAFPPQVLRLPSLEQLNLNHNALGRIPPELGALTSLRHLSLNATRIDRLPPELGALTNLVSLSVTDNPGLTRLPDELTGLASLESLFANDCALERLPDAFGDLEALVTLIVSGNRLTELPATFGQLPRLEVVVLANNQLRDPPEVLATLPKLKRVLLRAAWPEDAPWDAEATTALRQRLEAKGVQVDGL